MLLEYDYTNQNCEVNFKREFALKVNGATPISVLKCVFLNLQICFGQARVHKSPVGSNHLAAVKNEK